MAILSGFKQNQAPIKERNDAFDSFFKPLLEIEDIKIEKQDYNTVQRVTD